MTAICALHSQMRLVFRSCAKPHCITSDLRRRLHVPPRSPEQGQASKEARKSPKPRGRSVQGDGNLEAKSSHKKNLVLRPSKPSSLERPRRLDVPVRVFPKAQVTPGLVLSPQERLRVESMTRRSPKTVEKPAFRERMLIYHGGLRYTNYIALLRVTTIFAASFGLLILAPAYYQYDTAPWWTAPLIIVATTGPFFLVHFLARPFVLWIHLLLPMYARRSPSAALEYSKNLPRDALLQISFMRATGLVGNVDVRTSELIPKVRKWPPTTFEWVGGRVDTGTWLRPNITEFFVNKRSGTGKAARDTVPGIWKSVYTTIMGVERGAGRQPSK